MSWRDRVGDEATEVEDWAATGRATCRCGAQWVGHRIAHCSICHKTFGGVSGFDAHSVRGHCLTDAEIGARGYVRADGIWRMPMPEGTFSKEISA